MNLDQKIAIQTDFQNTLRKTTKADKAEIIANLYNPGGPSYTLDLSKLIALQSLNRLLFIKTATLEHGINRFRACLDFTVKQQRKPSPNADAHLKPLTH